MRAVVEEIHEFRYATEFEAPAAPVPVQSPATGDVPSIDGQVSSQAPGPVDISLPASAAAGIVDGESLAFEGIPTAFETRNLGITFEIEPIVSTDGRTIDLSLVPQHVCLLGMRKTEIELKSSRKKVVVEQPEIMSIRLTTSLQVKDGEHTLLGVFKINGPVDHMEFFILHTQLKRIEVTR